MSHLSARIVAFFSDSDTFFFQSNRPLNRKTTTFSSAEYILYLEKKANNILQAAVTKFPYFFGVDWHGGSTTMKECRYHFTRIA